MRLEWLEDILAVAETGSFTLAARRRNLTQSAFSRRIGAIEASLGVELFDRGRKPVQLHPAVAGQRDRIAARAIDLRQLVADLRRGGRQGGDRVVIASQHALTASLTPAIVARVGQADSNVHVRLRSANLNECFSLLLSGQADIALAYRLPDGGHPVDTDFIETALIGADRLVPVFSAVREGEVRAGLGRGELSYVAYPQDVFLGEVMARGVLPQIRQIDRLAVRAETALTLAAVEMAAVGVAVAWVPRSLAEDRIRRRDLCDLSDILPGADLAITAVRLRQTAGPVQALVWACLPDAARAEPAG
jgi:DNA-binding transcriptional LysR family regulator